MFSSMLPSERSAKIVCSTCRKYEAKEKHSITAVYRVDVIVNGWWLLPVLVGAAVSQTIQMIFFFDVLCARRSFSFGSHCLAFRYCCLRWASCTLFVESTISLLFSIFVLSSTTMIRSPESRTVGFFGTRHKKKMNKRNFLLALKEEKRRTTRAKTRSKATQRLLKFYFWVQPGETDSKISVVQKSTCTATLQTFQEILDSCERAWRINGHIRWFFRTPYILIRKNLWYVFESLVQP